jgi:hypothetical protein
LRFDQNIRALTQEAGSRQAEIVTSAGVRQSVAVLTLTAGMAHALMVRHLTA